jgi:hypothetical protein
MSDERREQKKRKRKTAIDLMPIIDAVQDSLDRLQVLYEEKCGDLSAAALDLRLNIEDLEDAIDKFEGKD